MRDGRRKLTARLGSLPADGPSDATVVRPDWLARACLIGWLSDHAGLNPVLDGERVELGVAGLACTVRIHESYDQSTPVVPLVFDVIQTGTPTVITEIIAAPGKDLEASTLRSTGCFAASSLAVVLRMNGVDTADGVETALIRSASAGTNATWDWYIGKPLAIYVNSAERAELETFISQGALLNSIIDHLIGCMTVLQVHWWKCFVQRRADGIVTGEVAIDNIPQPSALEELKRLQFPIAGPFAVRQFATVRPRESSMRSVRP